MDRVDSCISVELEQEEFQIIFGKYILRRKNPNQEALKQIFGNIWHTLYVVIALGQILVKSSHVENMTLKIEIKEKREKHNNEEFLWINSSSATLIGET